MSSGWFKSDDKIYRKKRAEASNLLWERRGRAIPISGDQCKRFSCCGVYAIRNLLTGDMYVGSGKNMYTRMRLNVGLRANRKMKSALDEFGIGNFEFLILEKLQYNVNKKNRMIAESRWQQKLQPTYNIRIIAVVSGKPKEPHSDESKMMMSNSLRGIIRTKVFKRNLSNRLKGNQYCKGRLRPDREKNAISAGLKLAYLEGRR